MTRGQIKERAYQVAGLRMGDDVYGDDFATNNALNRITDTYAGPGMDCYWTTAYMALTAGVSPDTVPSSNSYSLPAIYKPKDAQWLDTAGKWNPLRPISEADMNRMSNYWKNDPPTSFLNFIVFQGVNAFTLYPLPNAALAAANSLQISGYAQTCVSGISTWPNDNSACPLPSWCHDAIAQELGVDMLSKMIASDDERLIGKATRILQTTDAKQVARDLRGSAEMAAAQFYQTMVKPRISTYWALWSI